MKIRCEKCGADISDPVDRMFEQYEIGQLVCPSCKHRQLRYVSETDILFYFALSCTFYVLIASLVLLIVDRQGYSFWAIAEIILIFFIAWKFEKTLSKKQYKEAYFKEKWKTTVFEEDGSLIKKNIRFQFLIFITMVFVLGNGTMDYLAYLLIIIAYVATIFVRFYLSLKRENNQIADKKEKSECELVKRK